jgi:hypothetical protein
MPESSSIYVDKSPTHGKGIFSNRNLSVGDCLYTATPVFIGVLSWERLVDTCSNCFRRDGEEYFESRTQVKACSQCKLLRFCSTVGIVHLLSLYLLRTPVNTLFCGNRIAKQRPGKDFISMNARNMPRSLKAIGKAQRCIHHCGH